MIDLEGLVEQIDLISSRYVDEITRDWDRQLQRYFVDLRKDPQESGYVPALRADSDIPVTAVLPARRPLAGNRT